MSDVFLTRRGGGANLNFRIKQYPENADLSRIIGKENDIAVLTDTPISSWEFSCVTPSDPVSGMVWFFVKNRSAMSFNALKKHGIFIYPTSCKQYIGGSWVDKKASIYQSGSWVSWQYRVYNLAEDGYAIFDTLFTKVGGSHISYSQSGNFIYLNSGTGQGALIFKTPIDLSAYETMKVYGKNGNGIGNGAGISSSNTSINKLASTDFSGTEKTYTVDLRGLTGVGYPMIYVAAPSTSNNCYFKEILLE